jgi:hypothetical protein
MPFVAPELPRVSGKLWDMEKHTLGQREGDYIGVREHIIHRIAASTLPYL